MAWLQLSVQLTVLLMILSPMSSIFSLSDAARCGTFSQGAHATTRVNPAHTTGCRWLTAGVDAESSSGQSYTRHWVDNQSAATKISISAPGEEELESRRESSVAAAGSIDYLQRLNPRADFDDESSSTDEYLQLLQRIDLLRRLDVPVLGIWQITDDEEENCRSKAFLLGVDGDAQILKEILDFFLHLQEANSPNGEALQTDMSSPGMWQSNDDKIVMDFRSRNRALLADIPPPGIWEDAEVNDDIHWQKRRVLADISPPGMWSDDSDDLENRSQKRRLLADVSPTGSGHNSMSAVTSKLRRTMW
ncbi:hypothetical protein R1flu_017747 [Riccia fluitans]|uniref:Uncharacterized protein n=1 Tax=Riccia fluitans TaxID=41844 RepID=A0ABD1ZDV2_9MARC